MGFQWLPPATPSRSSVQATVVDPNGFAYLNTASGGNFKDRGVGTIFRYNYLGDSAARQIDLVEIQDATGYVDFTGYLSTAGDSTCSYEWGYLPMRTIILIALMAFVAATCHAQNTTVTATVTDPNTQPYAFSTGYAALVCPGNQAPTYNGFSIPRTFPITGFDGTGTFTQVLYDVSVLVPTGCGYQWHITYKDGVTNFIAGTITSITGTSVNESAAISAFAVLLPVPPATTPPGGLSGQLQYNNSGTFGGVLGTAVTPSTGAIAHTAGADTTTPLALIGHSPTQSKPLFDVNMNSTFTPDAPVTVRGFGFGIWSQGGGTALMHFEADAGAGLAPVGWFVSNKRSGVNGSGAPFGAVSAYCGDTGLCQLAGGGYDANGNYLNQVYESSGRGLVISNSENNNLGLSAVETILINPTFSGGAPTHDILNLVPASGNAVSGFDVNTNLFFKGSTSGIAKLGVAAAAGAPCTFLLPTTSPTAANQILTTAAVSGGSCQTSWASTLALSATSAAFATATTAGTCVQNTTSVTGATTAMAVSVSPVSTPGVGAVWSGFVSSGGNVTINECAVATSAGGTIAFNIRVTP